MHQGCHEYSQLKESMISKPMDFFSGIIALKRISEECGKLDEEMGNVKIYIQDTTYRNYKTMPWRIYSRQSKARKRRRNRMGIREFGDFSPLTNG